MNEKLLRLAEIEGRTIEDLLESATFNSVARGICTNPECSYTTDVEPDQEKGYCEECNTNTVASCAILAGII